MRGAAKERPLRNRGTSRLVPRIVNAAVPRAPSPRLAATAIELTVWELIGESGVGVATSSMVEPRHGVLLSSAEAARPSRPIDAAARALDDVMDRCARGDDAAFDELYRSAAPRIRAFLLRLCGDRALADDLNQEVFLRIHRARGSFAAGSAALPWILAIARNGFRDHVRRAQLRPAPTRSGDDPGALREAAPETRGDEVFFGQEMLAVVRRALQAMPVMQREAFVLIRFEGLSVGDAARILGATEGAVKLRAFRAYEALRAALDGASTPTGPRAP